jgi:hypothetical protein
MKYIINTGCSYGVMFRSIKKFSKGNNSDFKIIDLHCDSHGSEYQKRSVIYTISNLLDSGIDSSNIFVITEWSQPNRLFIELPKENSKHILENLNESEGVFVLNNKFERESDSNLIRKYKSLNVIIGDRVYLNPDVDSFDDLEDESLIYYLEKFKDNCHISHKPIDRLEQYMTNIFDLQNYLKANEIDYRFFLMNNTFEGYYSNFSHAYGLDSTYQAVGKENIVIPNVKKLMHIKEFSEYIKQIWNYLDLNKFVFYKTDNFNYGGIDEYVMEKFGHQAYTAGANEWDIPDEGYVTSFGAHPHDSVYIDFFRDYLYEWVSSFIGEIEFDMSDRWGKDKHNAIRQ